MRHGRAELWGADDDAEQMAAVKRAAFYMHMNFFGLVSEDFNLIAARDAGSLRPGKHHFFVMCSTLE
jgi:hypothetical protein